MRDGAKGIEPKGDREAQGQEIGETRKRERERETRYKNENRDARTTLGGQSP